MMRKGPILLDKVISSNRNKLSRTIGVVGAHQGVGVTYTAFMIAFYLSESLGEETAFLECNSHHDFELIHNAYSWTSENLGSFSFHQLTCFKEVMDKQYGAILNQNYENVVLDFGAGTNTMLDEFLRCSIKIIIGGLAPWNQEKLTEFVSEREELFMNRSIIYLIPSANKSARKRLSRKLYGQIYELPYEREPTMLSKKSCKLFKSIFTY
ncbi:MAG TPA: hypothetical protein GX731_01615 [Clostridiales bacterium]|nr:hypothetical protein [Clostridiales bacterium]